MKKYFLLITLFIIAIIPMVISGCGNNETKKESPIITEAKNNPPIVKEIQTKEMKKDNRKESEKNQNNNPTENQYPEQIQKNESDEIKNEQEYPVEVFVLGFDQKSLIYSVIDMNQKRMMIIGHANPNEIGSIDSEVYDSEEDLKADIKVLKRKATTNNNLGGTAICKIVDGQMTYYVSFADINYTMQTNDVNSGAITMNEYNYNP